MRTQESEKINITHDQIKREVMQKVKHGQTITVDSETGLQRVHIVAFYPHYVLCHNGFGYETCIDYFTLWTRLHMRFRNVNIPERIKGVV